MWWGTWNYNPSTNINDFSQNDFSIYPNPTNGIVNIFLKNEISANTGIVVSSINGRVVLSKNYNTTNRKNISIDLTGNAKGVYFVNIKSGGKVSSEKIILK